MFLRFATFSVCKLLKCSTSPAEIKTCSFRLGRAMRQKKSKKSGGFFSKEKKEANNLKIVKPGNCADFPKPILDPLCKVAVVVGGASGFGFAAADHLLCKGARGIVIADDDPHLGEIAAQKLCDSHGKNRAHFLQCDIRNTCQFEAGLKHALHKYKQIHILFNDLDKQRFPLSSSCKDSEPNWSNTTKAIQAGLKIIGKQNGGPGGAIVNCASILGFMGWPDDPYPVYCMKEPAVETTIDLSKEFNAEESGVRLLALCPANKSFSEIGLPDFPDPVLHNCLAGRSPCIPSSKWRIGTALTYVLAWGKSGSVWLVEPETCPREIPRQIHFPSKEGEKIDPKVYETHPCSITLEPRCVDTSKACSSEASQSCEAKTTKKK